SVDEGDGTVSAEVTLSSQSSSPVVVSYSVLTGPGQTATPGADYVAVPAADLTFAPSETTKTITITVNNDGAAEDRETFSLTLREPYNATLGTPSSAVMGINLNDGFFDPPLIGVSASHASDVNEGDTLTFVLTASRALSQTETVPVGINVSQRGDFLATAVQPSSVDFAPGATTVVFTVDTVNDGDLEVDGSVTVGVLIDSVLVNPRWLVDASAGSATVGILSEEISGRFDIDSSLILLGEGESRTVRVSLRTLGGSAMTATVPVELDYDAVPASGADLTGHGGATFDPATVDMDFPAQSGTLTIAAGTQFTDLVVRTINDNDHERRERFVVNFSNPKRAAAPLSPKVIMQIGFNDVVTRELRLERTDGGGDINEGESAQFRVFSDAPVAVDTHVSLTCEAESGRRFSFTGCDNVFIPAGASFVDFTLNVVLSQSKIKEYDGGWLRVTINPRTTATPQNPTVYTTPSLGPSHNTSVWRNKLVDRVTPPGNSSFAVTFDDLFPGATGVKAYYNIINDTPAGLRRMRFSHQLGGAGGLIPGAVITDIDANDSDCIGAAPAPTAGHWGGGLVSVRELVVDRGNINTNVCTVIVTFNVPLTAELRSYTNMTSDVVQQSSNTGGGSLIIPGVSVSVTIEDRVLAVEVTPASVPKGGKMRITYTLTNATGSNLTDMFFRHIFSASGGIFEFIREEHVTVDDTCLNSNVDLPFSGSSAEPIPSGHLTVRNVRLNNGESCAVTIDVNVPTTGYDFPPSNQAQITRTVSTTAVRRGGPTGSVIGASTPTPVTVTITQAPAVGVAALGSPINEGSPAMFRIYSDHGTGLDGLAVSVRSEDEGDFIDGTPETMFTIPGGMNAVAVDIPTEDDDRDEPDGLVRMTVESGSAYSVASANSATVTVRDNDVPDITITGPEFVHEGEPLRFTVQSSVTVGADLVVKLGRGHPGPGTVINNMGATLTVGTGGGGYVPTLPADTVTIPEGSDSAVYEIMTTNRRGAGASNGYVIVEVLGGAGYTYTETTQVSWVANDPSEKYIQIRRVPAPVVYITPQTTPIQPGADARFTVASDTIIPSGNLTVNIQTTAAENVISGTANSSVVLEYDRTGTARSASYIVPTSAITLGSVTATLQDHGATPPHYTVDSSRRSALIEHVGAMPLIRIFGGAPVAEGQNAAFTVNSSALVRAGEEFTVNLMPENGADDDFLGDAPRTVTFGAGMDSRTVLLPTVNDNAYEEDGIVRLTLVDGSGYDVLTAPLNMASVAVSSDDVPVVSINGAEFIHEGDTLEFTVLSDIPLSDALTVNVSRGEVSRTEIAQSDDGFVDPGMAAVSQMPVVIAADSTSAKFQIQTINHRGVKNGHGHFKAEIWCIEGETGCQTDSGGHPGGYTGQSPYSYAGTGGSREHQIQIREVEPPVISVAPKNPGNIMPGEDAEFIVRASSFIPFGGITVGLGTRDDPLASVISGTPPASVRFDYDKTSPVLSSDVVITTQENNGDVIVSVEDGTGYTVADAPDNEATVTSFDPRPTVGISADRTYLLEGDEVRFAVSLSEAPGTGETLEVVVTVADVSGSDFVATGEQTQTFTFNAGETVKTHTVTVVEDTTPEGDGDITAAITTPGTTAYRISPAEVSVSVRDDDTERPFEVTISPRVTSSSLPTFTFSYKLTNKTGSGVTGISFTHDLLGNDGLFNVVSDGSTDRTISDCVYPDGNTTGGKGGGTNPWRYNSNYGLIRFQNVALGTGQQNRTCTFTVTVSPFLSSNPPGEISNQTSRVTRFGGAEFAPPERVSVILQRAVPEFRIVRISPATVSESDPMSNRSIVFEVSLDRAAEQEVTVKYGFNRGSADHGADFTVDSPHSGPLGTLTFAAGESGPERIEVSIIDDRLDEQSETVVLRLFDPSTGSQLPISQFAHRATATITDSDTPVLMVSANTASVTEGASASFRIDSDIVPLDPGVYAANVTVAEIGASDFVANEFSEQEVTLTFGKGTTVFYDVPTIDRPGFNLPGGVRLTLHDNAGVDYTAGSPNSAAVIILNDDPQPVFIRAAQTEDVLEGDRVEFRLSSPFPAPPGGLVVTVNITDANGIIDGTARMTETIPEGLTSVLFGYDTQEDETQDVGGGTVTASIAADTRSPQVYTVVAGQGTASATVIDDDRSLVSIFPVNSTITEGASAGFRVRLSSAVDQTVLADITSSEGCTTETS
ncbi:MAG: hypothetical protein OXF45_03390, partial [Candidatus Dadabacteria bacterium]|nr:hypothetical protein [Candidatus Dadabacteria bacterium]